MCTIVILLLQVNNGGMQSLNDLSNITIWKERGQEMNLDRLSRDIMLLTIGLYYLEGLKKEIIVMTPFMRPGEKKGSPDLLKMERKIPEHQHV